MGKPDFQSATVEDLLEDPRKYGAPTFEDFRKGKYLKPQSEDDKMGLLDNGPNRIRKQIRKMKWIVNGFLCETAEDAEKVGASENIDMRKPLPELVDIGNHMCDVYLKFNVKKGLIIV